VERDGDATAIGVLKPLMAAAATAQKKPSLE